MPDKIRENRLRRLAERRGFQIEKSRRRDPLAVNYGTYWITDPHLNTAVHGDMENGYGLSLDEVEAWLIEVKP